MPMSPRLLRPVARSGFNPTRLSGLGLWLDASADSSLTFNGSTVSEWRDLSGNGRDFSQETAGSQPTTSTLNGRRVLSAAGSQFMAGNAASLTLFRNIPGATLIAAASFSTTNNTNLFFASVPTNAGVARAIMGRSTAFSNGFGFGGRRADSDSFQGAGYSAGTGNEVYASVADYVGRTIFVFAGGTQQASNTNFQATGNTSDTSSLGLGVFGTGIGGGLATATLGELLIYNRALSTEERQQAERYLGNKWGITVA
jgi:hypothetical protein